MKLKEWKEKENISYEELGRVAKLSTNKVFRLCEKSRNISLSDALKIVGNIPEVTFEDLLK